MQLQNKIKRLTLSSVLLCLSLIFSYIESIAVPQIVPGVKLGIANIIIMYAFICVAKSDALVISVLRVLIISMLFGNFATMIFSLLGALSSYAALYFCYFLGNKVSLFGSSVLSAALHGVGEIIGAMLIYGSWGLIYYLPIMLITSVPLGILSALILYVVFRINKVKANG